MTEAESNYTTTEKEMLAVVYAFEKFWSYLIMNKNIVYTDHSALKYLFAKKDYKARLLRWVYSFKSSHSKKPLTFSKLATIDPLGDIMARTTLPRRLKRKRSPPTTLELFANSLNLSLPDLELPVPSSVIAVRTFTMTSLQRSCLTYKTPIECTSYKLVYGKACDLPTELEHKAYWALKHANFNLQTAGDHRKVQLNELNELRDQAYENSLIYKEKTKRLYDSKIKERVFNVSDQLLLFNSRLKIFSCKLKTRWSGPFTITHVFSYGTVELSKTDRPNFKVNGHRLKHYFGEDIPKMVVPDLQTFPKDQ
nr:reverse transcriptase domain-containing protein [Tanacetum cinerariifolium]